MNKLLVDKVNINLAMYIAVVQILHGTQCRL